MSERLCGKGLHPYADRTTNRHGKSECRGCTKARQMRKRTGGVWDIVGPVVPTAWSQPVTNAERHARYDVWAVGLDDAIAMVRETEGFDGTRCAGQTLGEYLPLSASERRAMAPPVSLAEMRNRRLVSGRVVSGRASRFQDLARQDAGRLVG